MATRSKAWVCDRSFVGTGVSNPVGGRGSLSLVCIVWCQVEVSVAGSSLVQRTPTDCCVPGCDREDWIMGRPWLTGGCCAMGEELTVKL